MFITDGWVTGKAFSSYRTVPHIAFKGVVQEQLEKGS